MSALFDRLSQYLEALSEWVGKAVAWLTLAMVLGTVVVLVFRYLFNEGAIALQESVLYLHAMVFMLGAAYTLKDNEHVRVDVFYRKFSPRQQAWVNIIGYLTLLLPVTIFIMVTSWKFVAFSWRILEGSNEPGGLAIVYLLKSLLLVMPALLLAQGLAQTLRLLLFLAGKGKNPLPEAEQHV